MDNPYQSPSSDSELVVPAEATLRIEPFRVPWQGFQCKVLSAEEVSSQLHARMVEHCQELGFLFTVGEADYILEGTLLVVNEGNRGLRYLTSGMLGHAKVEAAGEVRGGPENQARAYTLKTRRMAGVFGGDSKDLLTQCIAELGYKISTEAGLVGRRINPQETSNAWIYLRFLFLLAAIAAALCGVGKYGLGTVGVTLTDEVIFREFRLAVVAAIATFGVVSLLGIALAPQWVLLSRTLHKLRITAGIQSILGIRLLLVAFAAIGAGLAVLICMEHVW